MCVPGQACPVTRKPVACILRLIMPRNMSEENGDPKGKTDLSGKMSRQPPRLMTGYG